MERAVRDETGANLAFINMGGVRDILPRASCWSGTSGTSCLSTTRVVVGTFKGRDLPAAVAKGRASRSRTATTRWR